MRVSYDKESDIFYICGQERIHVEEIENGVVVDLVGDDPQFPCQLSGIEVMGASKILPLGKDGYDPESDTLTLGETASNPDRITENGDFVGYWGEDPYDLEEYVVIGVSLRRASKYLAPLSLAAYDGPPECAFVSIYFDDLPKEAFYSKAMDRYVSRHLFYNVLADIDEWDFQHSGIAE